MGVLDGIRILELARVAPAELPAMMLADMGSEVLKIETPDPDRETGDEWVRRTIHAFVNRNKRSMTLNLKAPEGQAVFKKLAAGASFDHLARLRVCRGGVTRCRFGLCGPGRPVSLIWRSRPRHPLEAGLRQSHEKAARRVPRGQSL